MVDGQESQFDALPPAAAVFPQSRRPLWRRGAGHTDTSAAGLKGKPEELLELIAHDPYQSPPRFEKLVENLSSAISPRINIEHRRMYQVIEEQKTTKVLRMWTRYE
mgnify:FL=1